MPENCRKKLLFARACRLALGARAKRPGALCLVFVTNPQIRRINRKFLKHDYNTDVIAFPYTDDPIPRRQTPSAPSSPSQSRPFGDIFVSVDQARIQARGLGRSLLEELLTLAAHGALHLVGYDDHSASERRRMFARQDRIVQRILKI
ncbi:MAG: rRNA maturation RNase YbeY [Elusimicrobia bacterium]|nr:rRNA maturation RNase YbeY [Elusimicrobiota bacterium]